MERHEILTLKLVEGLNQGFESVMEELRECKPNALVIVCQMVRQFQLESEGTDAGR